MPIARIVTFVLLGAASLTAQAVSKWVYFGKDHRLHYAADPRGNRIMDFSHAGYGGGGVRMPVVRAVRTLSPVSGDNTAQIQAAIDAVAGLPLGAEGFRGAVLLGPGVYEVAGTLSLAASGVVLRGSGSGDGGTVIRMTGKPHRFLDIRGSGTWQAQGNAASITDAYVPSGADSFMVSDASGFQVGDTVLIRRPVTPAWIHFMEMDKLVRDGKPQTWIKAGTSINMDRVIESITGSRITLDVPLSDSFDAQYLNPPGTTIVKYTFPGRISQVGFESMRVSAPADDVPISGSQYTLLGMSAVSDAWVRDILVDETQNGIGISQSARRVTLERVHIRHNISHTGAAAPADIAVSGTQILLDRCSVTGKGTWPIVTQNGVTGPNVVLNFRCDEAGVSPHQRWASGLLVDSSEFRNNTERRPGVAFSNRMYAGSGHGWTVGWAVGWNVKTDYMLIQQPPGTINWCIGCTGRHSTIAWNGQPVPAPQVPSEVFESPGTPVTPTSLYLQQLRERLGDTALRNIGYGAARLHPN
ncbi:MAG: hypothetical protein EHM65_05035 [Acidobacteriales bacterium]|nr:MAG: hypothetical protein EHM65_05035 [Terriglobales bacterium]